MDVIIGIIIAVLFLVGSANKQKKREQAQREAKARTLQPPSADPRFPSVPSIHEIELPEFSGEASPGFEGEPVSELPVTPAPAAQGPHMYERTSTQTEGGSAATGSVVMPTAAVAAHMEATQGRRAMLEGVPVHAHTEGSMEGYRAVQKAAASHTLLPPQAHQPIVPDVLKRLGRDPGAVAEGVILSEILGKPKALRRI